MNNITKGRQLFLYAAPFLPLAFFKIWSSPDRAPEVLLVTALCMLAYCLLLLILAYRWDRPSYFDWAVTGYFAAVSCLLLTWPQGSGHFLARYGVTGIYAAMFSAAFFPPLFGLDPFTFHYAKRYTPEEFWGNPVFVRINLIMTMVWASVFALCLIISLYPSIVTRAFIPISLILGFGLPFNIRFPDLYLRRLGLPSMADQRRMAAAGTLRSQPALLSTQPPASAREAIYGMPGSFNPRAAKDLSVLICFVVSGEEEFTASIEISAGKVRCLDGTPATPDLIIRTPAQVWLDISSGRLDGQQAFFQKLYTAEGNIGLLIRMRELFHSGPVQEPAAPLPDAPEQGSAEPVATAEQPEEIPLTTKKEGIVKILALNSSPRTGGESKTELMLDALVEGMRAAGAHVDVVNLRQKTIKNCIGCYTCWTKTPGRCVMSDDMTNDLFPRWADSDLVVYATPLYYFGVTASMKAFIERTLPALLPFFESHDSITHHPMRCGPPRSVFLSVAGFPEYSVFDLLSNWVRFVFSGSLIAEIYRPGAELLTVPAFADEAREILSATRQAGHELVELMAVKPETLHAITRPITDDTAKTLALGNLMWKTCIAEGMTPREFERTGKPPRPDSLETFMIIFPMGFNPKRAGDVRAIIQFTFSGAVDGSCHFVIENGVIRAVPGTAEKPDLNIDTPFELWMDIMMGKSEGRQMLMEQRYKVAGDVSLLMRMNQLFGSPEQKG
jgi:putative sterol carrier protein